MISCSIRFPSFLHLCFSLLQLFGRPDGNSGVEDCLTLFIEILFYKWLITLSFSVKIFMLSVCYRLNFWNKERSSSGIESNFLQSHSKKYIL